MKSRYEISGRWISSIQWSPSPIITFGDGTTKIYSNEKARYLANIWEDHYDTVADWIIERNLTMCPDDWSESNKVLFQLTFG